MTSAAEATVVAMPPPPPPKEDEEENKARNKAPPRYGADDLTSKQFALIQLALVIGSSIEWFDFSVYGALSSVITPLFFPSSAGPETAALYYWGVFALSFVSRPIGSLLLGSVGDRWGRRPALLISLAGMAVPTVLIGCLPTYQMIGEAAPILLALLRAIQGLAMGAEFSSAMVYSVELAPRGKKGVFGSLTFQAGILGIALGNVAVMILTAALSAEQMRVWGWRLPFLLTAFSALGAFVLRMHMPEPRAWERECEDCAAGQETAAGLVVRDADKGAGLPVSDKVVAVAASAAAEQQPTGEEEEGAQRRRPGHRRPKHTPGVPVLKLVRHGWPQVLLQTFFEAFGSVAFYVFAMWLPSWHQSSGLMGAEAASGATIAALAFMAATSMLGGWASDACATPRRRLAAASLSIAVGTAVVIPGFLGVAGRATAAGVAAGHSLSAAAGDQTAAAFFQLGVLALTGFALGIVPSLCSELYKADVRVVSFSLAHNLSMSLLGGTAPLIISAMAPTAAGKKGAAPGVYCAAAGGASLLAAAVLAAGSRWLFVAAPVVGPVAEEEEEGVAAPPPVAAAFV